MNLTKKEKLLALSSALHLVGIELEASRETLEGMHERGIPLNSAETVEASRTFSGLALRFIQLEEGYLKLVED